LGIPFASLVTLHQVHGTEVKIIKCLPPDPPLVADAMVTASPGVALGILTADCAPVFFADREKKIIGACHAGWKGALAGVVEKTVKAMVDLGSKKTSIQAVIGPTICSFSYEVDEKFCQFFLTNNPASAIFFQSSSKKQHYQFDLPGFLIKKMEDFGLKNPIFIEKDTKTGPFFSRRQALESHLTQYGCGISVIMIN
jgi:YfiH family protein